MTFIRGFAFFIQFLLSIATALIFGAILLPIAWFACKMISIFAFGPTWMWFSIIVVVAIGAAVNKYEPQFRKLANDFRQLRENH